MPGFYNPPPTKRGYDVRECVSALQKAVRRSNPDDALYWATELFESGHAAWMWKRLKTITSEDIGPAAPGLAADVRALYENWKDEKQNGGGYLYMSHAVIAMCAAPKCRVADWAAHYHGSDVVVRRDIPDEALDKHTARGRKLGRGMQHFVTEASKLIQPDWTVPSFDEYLQSMVAKRDAGSLQPNPFQPTPTAAAVGDAEADGNPVGVHQLPGI